MALAALVVLEEVVVLALPGMVSQGLEAVAATAGVAATVQIKAEELALPAAAALAAVVRQEMVPPVLPVQQAWVVAQVVVVETEETAA